MPDIITDRFAEKQQNINQRRAEGSASYSELWSRLIAEWNSHCADNGVWLMYSANYLCRTIRIRCAIDPLALAWRIKEAPKLSSPASDLKRLSFVLLTHRHKDHLDLELLASLRHLPIIWVVPEFMLSTVIEEAGLSRSTILVPFPLRMIEIDNDPAVYNHT